MLVFTGHWRYFFSISVLVLSWGLQAFISTPVLAQPNINEQKSLATDFPTVDPNYIYDQLFFMVTHYQRRESGYLKPAGVPDGHAGFATYWAQEMTRDLQGFGPQTVLDSFRTTGWSNRPLNTNSTNVEVTIPGATHPEQTVVIGCHYDGEASSTQSANDDGSGCAIELGVAKALGSYWRAHNLYPARTLRFVIFDAEEQGLVGSFHYVNQTITGDLSSIVAMFNEEQNGIAYPLRYLGKASNPQLPLDIDISPTRNNDIYPQQDQMTATQKANINQFNALMQKAVPAVFTQFQAIGYGSLTYLNDKNQPVSQPIFGPDQLGSIHQQDDTEGGSDQIPFTRAGLPCATFLGNATYYDRNSPPPWSYPYDQPEDTIQLMNTFASGHAEKAKALTLSLALPGMLTTWMLHQPQILGEASALNHPLGSIGTIGLTPPGKDLKFSAYAFDPAGSPAGSFTYQWNFGDGSKAQGQNVTHRYQSAGNYKLQLDITSAKGRETIARQLSITNNPPTVTNPYADYLSSGRPPKNPLVKLPVPAVAVATPGKQSEKIPVQTSSSVNNFPWAIVIVVIVIAGLALTAILGVTRRRKHV